jgi:hypothetical protein
LPASVLFAHFLLIAFIGICLSLTGLENPLILLGLLIKSHS